MLHIVNGRSTLTLLEQANLPGELFSWEDMLMEGPVRSTSPAEQDWEGRAAWLDSHFGIPAATYLAGMRESLDALERAREHEETVLWFENDLFCQVHLVFLLEHFRLNPLPGRLSLVCPVDERLGRLSVAQLQELFDGREPVQEEKLAIGQHAWSAFTATDPLQLLGLFRRGLPPATEQLLLAHFRRFPSTANGLNAVEDEALRALTDGTVPFRTLFPAVITATSVYPLGIGDTQFAVYLSELATRPQPSIRREGAAEDPGSWTLSLLPHGLALLNKHEDWLATHPLDRWLGGVHLVAGLPAWRWDEATRSFRLPGAL